MILKQRKILSGFKPIRHITVHFSENIFKAAFLSGKMIFSNTKNKMNLLIMNGFRIYLLHKCCAWKCMQFTALKGEFTFSSLLNRKRACMIFIAINLQH